MAGQPTLREKCYHLTAAPLKNCCITQLGHNDTQAQVKLLHDASVKLLDIVYLKFEEIYSKLCMAATGESCVKDGRQSLAIISSDLMLLAVSVIGAASYIVNQTTSDMVNKPFNSQDLIVNSPL